MREEVLKNKIQESLKNNYNFPMIGSVEVKYVQTSDTYLARLILKESFEFYFENGITSNKFECEIPNTSHLNINGLNTALYNADIKDKYTYKQLNSMSQNKFDSQYIKLAEKFFLKNVYELTRQESNIVFHYINFLKYNNSSEIVEEFHNFYKAYGRFPYKKEHLYKVLEYAKETNFITKEDLDKIYSLASSFAFDKLCEFIEKNKRWPYPNEKEYSRTWDEVCWNYRLGLYSKEQLIKIEVLYSRFNNSKESIGERLVNSYIAGLGYKFEKQKTFPDLVYKDKLRFDTCVTIDDKILLIEYDGIQHFEPIDYFGGEEGLRETQTRDRLKDEYCRTNNIPLLRISYDQSKDLENMIGNFISENIKKEHSK